MELNAGLDRAKKDNKKLKKENTKLVEENVKMTKRRAKLECKLKEAIRESKKILIEVGLAVKYYEEKGSYPGKKFKQIIKNHSK